MNRILSFFSIAIFSIFLGSQITEGCLLVPYWKMLSRTEFYEYYSKFGPSIGKFYTALTIIATLIPISISIYCFSNKLRALKYSVLSSLFAFLIIVLFYAYFKDANQQFYEITFNANQLKSELKTWEYWHWLRVLLEFLSLIFLILALNVLSKKESSKDHNQTIKNII
tara:strand:+ start:982 stop:1485 length:504 start_codon:yes stop_codon:yes gene_type:complete